MNTEEIHIGIGVVMYIGYNVLLNWVYIKEYLHKDTNGVIKRGKEWER
jgi:hypothetical protein